MGKPCPRLLFYSTGGVTRSGSPRGIPAQTFMLPDPGDLHNMNHWVPAQRCLAGKSGLASLIIVRALALPVPGFTHTGFAGCFLRRRSPGPRLFAPSTAGSLASRCQANAPSGAGAGPWGLRIPPGALPAAGGLGTLPRAPTGRGASPRSGGQPSGCLRGGLGHVWSTGSVASRSSTGTTSPKGGRRSQGRCWERGSGGVGWAARGWSWCPRIAGLSVRMGRFLPGGGLGQAAEP